MGHRNPFSKAPGPRNKSFSHIILDYEHSKDGFKITKRRCRLIRKCCLYPSRLVHLWYFYVSRLRSDPL